LKQYQKCLIKEVKSTLESDHLNPVNELKSMMVMGSEFQAFMIRSLKSLLLFGITRITQFSPPFHINVRPISLLAYKMTTV